MVVSEEHRIVGEKRDMCFGSRCDESTVGEKRFDDFNDFSRNVEFREFEKKSGVPDSIEGFLYVKEDRSSVNVVVKVLAELVSEFSQLLRCGVLKSKANCSGRILSLSMFCRLVRIVLYLVQLMKRFVDGVDVDIGVHNVSRRIGLWSEESSLRLSIWVG
ncbi:hypothetical protein QTP88_007550 [Uroleucon formosanum]